MVVFLPRARPQFGVWCLLAASIGVATHVHADASYNLGFGSALNIKTVFKMQSNGIMHDIIKAAFKRLTS